MPRFTPDRKTGWSGLTGAATTSFIFLLHALFGIKVGPEVASALVTCIVAVASYLTNHESEIEATRNPDPDPTSDSDT
jgi:hypothetical protein